MTEPHSPAMRIVVHGTNVTDETVAAVVVAFSTTKATPTATPMIPAWQLAGFHESRSDLTIIRPQQLSIRGNKQW